MSASTRPGFRRYLAVVALGAAGLSGCAGVSEPKTELGQAQTAIAQAETSNAPTYAPGDLYLARQKLQNAQEAVRKDENLKARRLAEESAVDAELAEAKAQAESNRRSVGEMQRTVGALKSETRQPAMPAPSGAMPAPSGSSGQMPRSANPY